MDQILSDLITDSEKKYGLTKPTQSNIENFTSFIPQLIEKLNPTEFYQWFCPIWQAFISLYSDIAKPDDWTELFSDISKALTETGKSKPTLRAMCMSYMITSPNIPKESQSQAIALRMLFLFATQVNELSTDSDFVSWILSFTKDFIQDMFQISEHRDLFIEVCIEFFSQVPKFDTFSLKSLISFVSNQYIVAFVKKLNKPAKASNKEENEKIKAQLRALSLQATISALNYKINFDPSEDRLLDESLFIFEVLYQTVLVDFLDDETKEILHIFAEGMYKDFKQFINAHSEFVQKNQLSISDMTSKIQLLTFVSIAGNKDKLTYDEICTPLELEPREMRKLVVMINSTKTAIAKINAVEKVITVENCQPRIFSDKDWDSMTNQLQVLVDSLSKATNP